MLEVREREGSDVQTAASGREASKHSAEVGKPQERDKEVSQNSQCIASETRRSRDIQPKTVRQNLVACVGTPAQQCKRKRELGHERSHREQ